MQNTHKLALVFVSSLAFLFSGCGKKEAPVEPVAVQAETAKTGAAAKAPLPGDKAMAAAGARQNPHAAGGGAAMDGAHTAPGGALGGEVLEAIAAGTYTYLRLKTGEGELWAAVPATPAKVGDKVALAGAMEMKNF